MIITTHSGDRLNLTDHIHKMCKLADADFRSVENMASLSRLGQCIALAAGSNAPHAILVRLRGKMSPELWSYVGDLWAEASEYRYIGEDGRRSYRPPVARASWGGRPKRAEKHVSVLDAILTPVLVGPYEALLSKPIRPVRSGELASCTQCDPQR